MLENVFIHLNKISLKITPEVSRHNEPINHKRDRKLSYNQIFKVGNKESINRENKS